MSRAAIFMVLIAAGCSGGSGGSTKEDGDPQAVFVDATGMVTNPISAVQSGRLIVGVAKPADVPQKVICDKLIVKFEAAAATLPAAFQLQRVPAGELVLVALLIDGSGGTRMPGAAYEITADAAGVRFKNMPRPASLEVAMQGTIAFECP